MELYNPTRSALEEWKELIEEVAGPWVRLMDDDGWNDLPPDICQLIITASNAYADVKEAVAKELDLELNLEDEDDGA